MHRSLLNHIHNQKQVPPHNMASNPNRRRASIIINWFWASFGGFKNP